MEKTKSHRRNPNAHYDGTDRLTAEGRDELKNSDYGLPGRRFPMPDAEHVRAAEAQFHFASDEDKPELARNILDKAKKFGVDVESENVLHWAGKEKK
ncbi:MAG: hypothetical protein LIO79_06085 [Rikenellaceae bacterium]|nr:hypothetical protein [Rikenellaceae bacterium]